MSFTNEGIQAPIVSCEWLRAHLHEDDVRVVEASWHMPAAGRDARAEFAGKHIPGALFFDIDEHSSPSVLPHMLPSAEQFSAAAGALGIASHHRIVVYDSLGLFSAARVWWMFRHFGAKRVYILDGGLPEWERTGGALASQGDPSDKDASDENFPSSCEFVVNSKSSERQREVVNAEQVLAAIDDQGSVILDARAAGRFTAEVKETREGLRSGHIPGSVSLPFTQVLDEQGRLKSRPELVALFDELKLSRKGRIITSCGSGVTAAVLSLALDYAGYADVAIYDGSWTEWGALDGAPVATGP